jgi:hypothetical protein
MICGYARQVPKYFTFPVKKTQLWVYNGNNVYLV